ncbi:MAG TPA: MFS transporter [Candidatus Sulfotelmatobacter sp.]|nr:MFS transporter [Candidatus Sulfotelmatobacter sp.]
MNNTSSGEQPGSGAVDQLPLARDSHPGMNRVVFLLAAAVLINYIDRSNLSIAAPLLKDELGLSGSQLGTLLSAFFWTYAVMQIPAGWLVDRFDVKWVFALGFFVWSAATAVTGVLHGFAALLVIRVVLGLGESVAFPSVGKILGSYFEESRRGFANAAVMAGLALGPALGMLVGGNVVGRFGWRPFFVTLGLLGFLWLGPWWAWMPRRAHSSAAAPGQKPGILDVLRHQSAWGTCICQFALNYPLYFLVTWLPFYLVRGRGFSMTHMARVGGLVFLLYAVSSVIFGKLSDRWIAAGATPTRVRKSLAILGNASIGVFLVASALAPDVLCVPMLALTGFSMGISSSNLWAITQTLAGPQMVGRWVGVQNFVGNFAGAVAPALTGFLLDRTGQYYWAFFITAAVTWTGVLSWVFVVGPVEEVDWGKHLRRALTLSACAAPETPRP